MRLILYTSRRGLKAMPMEAGEVAMFAAVTAAIDKVRKVLEALSGCYSWVIARVLG